MPLVILCSGDGAVSNAVKIFCLHEAYICRIRKEPALKPWKYKRSQEYKKVSEDVRGVWLRNIIGKSCCHV